MPGNGPRPQPPAAAAGERRVTATRSKFDRSRRLKGGSTGHGDSERLGFDRSRRRCASARSPRPGAAGRGGRPPPATHARTRARAHTHTHTHRRHMRARESKCTQYMQNVGRVEMHSAYIYIYIGHPGQERAGAGAGGGAPGVEVAARVIRAAPLHRRLRQPGPRRSESRIRVTHPCHAKSGSRIRDTHPNHGSESRIRVNEASPSPPHARGIGPVTRKEDESDPKRGLRKSTRKSTRILDSDGTP